MKAASDALIALLQLPQTLMAHLLTITTLDGSTYCYTDGDMDIHANSNIYYCNQVMFSRGALTTKVGLEVQTLDLTLYTTPDVLIGGIPFIEAVANGLLDGATINLDRAYMQRWGDVFAGVLYLFSGRVADVSVSRYSANITVKSWMELLDTPMPHNHFQAACPNELFDTFCTLSKAAYEVTKAVEAGSTTLLINNASLTEATNYWQLGRIVFTSGPNTGVRRVIRSSASGSLVPITPLPNAPTVGDTFKLIPGCDKSNTTCTNKFNNALHFRGCPAMPDPGLLS